MSRKRQLTEIRFRNSRLAPETVKLYTQAVRLYFEWLRARKLSVRFNIDNIREWLSTYNNAATFNLYRQALKEFYFWQNGETRLDRFTLTEAFDAVKRRQTYEAKRHGEHWLTREEVEEMAEQITPKYAVLIKALFWSGCRVSELINIRLQDCRNGKNPVVVRILGKGAKERDVYLPEEVFKRAKKVFSGKEYLFETAAGTKYGRTTISKELTRQTRRKCKTSIHAHTLRHSRAMDLLNRQKLSPDKIARALGHARVTTTLSFYLHGTPGPDEMGVAAPGTKRRRGARYENTL